MKTLTEIKEDVQTEEAPKTIIDPAQVKATAYLKKTYRRSDVTKLDVRFLWGNAYRLNFWGRKELAPGRGVDNHIIESLFVRVNNVNDVLEVVEYDK